MAITLSRMSPRQIRTPSLRLPEMTFLSKPSETPSPLVPISVRWLPPPKAIATEELPRSTVPVTSVPM